MRVLSLCDLTGNMVRPWAEAGAECVCVDLQHPSVVQEQRVGEGVVRLFGGSVRWPYWQNEDSGTWDFVIAQPPCTHLAGSGARWWADKGLGPLVEALQLVKACVDIAEAAGCPWMLENPVGRLSTCWRKPDHVFDPYEYAGYDAPDDHYTKRTCLWTGGGFVMPEPKYREDYANNGFPEPDKTRIHHCSPGPERANIRSAAPLGFARAVFEANRERCGLVRS